MDFEFSVEVFVWGTLNSQKWILEKVGIFMLLIQKKLILTKFTPNMYFAQNMGARNYYFETVPKSTHISVKRAQ